VNFHYKCLRCDFFEKDGTKELLTCPKCGSNLDITYNYDDIKLKQPQIFNMFLHPELMPISVSTDIFRTKIGGTPLIESRTKKYLFFKDDSRNPSLSFKDRASAIAILKSIELNKKGIVTASTGNAAASLATLSALTGQKCVIFVPESAPKGKLIQILIHGAKLIKVKGSYDQAFDIATEFSKVSEYYLRNTGINPFMTEGKKTAAYEIAYQLNYEVPDNVFVSVGDGCIIGSTYKGFYELKMVGKIDKIPRIYGVQAMGANPIFRAFKANKEDIEQLKANTIADSISVGNPQDYQKALRAVRKSGGDFIEVSDKEIMDAQREMAVSEGLYAEPAAAAAFAGYLKKKLEGKTVILITGNGLKDVDATEKSFNFDFISIDPNNYDIEEINEKI
jgi:threonine synthase